MSLPGEGAGKGDTPRPLDKKKYDETWIRIFGKKCRNCKGFGEVRIVTPDDETEIKGEEVQTCSVCKGLGKVEK